MSTGPNDPSQHTPIVWRLSASKTQLLHRGARGDCLGGVPDRIPQPTPPVDRREE